MFLRAGKKNVPLRAQKLARRQGICNAVFMGKTNSSKRSRNPEQGMNWCRLSTRMAIYHRDGFCCVYCGTGSEDGRGLTLDHLLACELGGTNDATNLVTCCRSCNSAKGALTMRSWLRRLADGGVDAAQLRRRVARQSKRPLDRAEGRRLAALRTTTTAAKAPALRVIDAA